MTNKELLKRIDELERRVRDLEARPVYIPVPAPWAPPPSRPYIGDPVPAHWYPHTIAPYT